ncbi:MAG TPA: ABC transporter substrate-binding protein [Xanthobacteraceae bacterium]|jgi:putative ABC transport system substrate-binding protein|nr:ABC transporter substrate-binding protein [Xanthobacteraceae bacterium]
MKRRDFMKLLGGAAVTWPLAARAQQEMPLVGFLISGAAGSFAIFVEAFKQGMRDNGMIEGRDYVLDLRYADGDYSRFQTLAAELVQRKPAVIVVTTISAARAAQRATSTIPIVMTGLIDPVGQGLIASLARPGGNTTGLANLAQDVMPKLVEILRGTFPAIRDIAVLFNPANPANRELSKVMPAQAGSIGVTVRLVEFTTVSGLDATFATLARQPPEALVVMSDAALYDLREPISALALKHRFPTITYVPEFTDAGALMSYGPPRRAMYHRAAEYVKKILTGAKPADLPVQQPTQVELSINLQTAKALGITIPDTVLARADRVIE